MYLCLKKQQQQNSPHDLLMMTLKTLKEAGELLGCQFRNEICSQSMDSKVCSIEYFARLSWEQCTQGLILICVEFP